MRCSVEGSFVSKMMELSHEITGGLFSLFSPFDPWADGHGFRVSFLQLSEFVCNSYSGYCGWIGIVCSLKLVESICKVDPQSMSIIITLPCKSIMIFEGWTSLWIILISWIQFRRFRRPCALWYWKLWPICVQTGCISIIFPANSMHFGMFGTLHSFNRIKWQL